MFFISLFKILFILVSISQPIDAATMENNMEISQKIKIEFPYIWSNNLSMDFWAYIQ